MSSWGWGSNDGGSGAQTQQAKLGLLELLCGKSAELARTLLDHTDALPGDAVQVRKLPPQFLLTKGGRTLKMDLEFYLFVIVWDSARPYPLIEVHPPQNTTKDAFFPDTAILLNHHILW